jgi:hypothetical protein
VAGVIAYLLLLLVAIFALAFEFVMRALSVLNAIRLWALDAFDALAGYTSRVFDYLPFPWKPSKGLADPSRDPSRSHTSE